MFFWWFTGSMKSSRWCCVPQSKAFHKHVGCRTPALMEIPVRTAWQSRVLPVQVSVRKWNFSVPLMLSKVEAVHKVSGWARARQFSIPFPIFFTVSYFLRFFLYFLTLVSSFFHLFWPSLFLSSKYFAFSANQNGSTFCL